MTWIDALILGIVQGLAEYLPISSSGHLEMMRHLLDQQLSGAESLEFDVMLHVATVLSTIVVLRKEFAPLVFSFFSFRRDANTTYVWKLIVSAIPIAIVGFCFKDFVEECFGGNLTIVGICELVTAALLVFAYLMRTRFYKPQHEHGHKVRWIDAIVIGLSQAVAVLPGLSRSGTTIATGISMGVSRTEIARFSFFMVIIPILGEAMLDGLKLAKGTGSFGTDAAIGWTPMIVGFIASFVVGCAACKWMIELVRRGHLVWFAIYCAVVGVLCLCF